MALAFVMLVVTGVGELVVEPSASSPQAFVPQQSTAPPVSRAQA
jgi:hypothetical protein